MVQEKPQKWPESEKRCFVPPVLRNSPGGANTPSNYTCYPASKL
jgi:hypothetical protein